MRLLRVRLPGAGRPWVRRPHGQAVDVSAHVEGSGPASLADGGLHRLRDPLAGDREVPVADHIGTWAGVHTAHAAQSEPVPGLPILRGPGRQPQVVRQGR